MIKQEELMSGKCRVDKKTTNLLMALVLWIVAISCLLSISFLQEVVRLVNICIYSHSRKLKPQKTRCQLLTSWLTGMDTEEENEICD